MSNLEVLVSPQDFIALGSIHGCQKCVEESFYVHVEANVCIWWFLRYQPISVQHSLTDISMSIDYFEIFWASFERSS